jgi:hypothetical protein
VYTRIVKVGGVELSRILVFTNMTFVLLLFIKIAVLCSVDLLYCVC